MMLAGTFWKLRKLGITRKCKTLPHDHIREISEIRE
jgi:hypothetical protein